MDDKGKIAMAVAGGYLLGRTKKGKLALSVALWLAGSQLGLDPKKLARDGITKLGSSPQLADLGDKLRGPVVDAGKRAAIATVESRVNRLADALQERAHPLAGEDGSDADDQQEATDDAEGYADEEDEGDTGEETEREDEGARTSDHSGPTRRSTRTAKTAKKTSASKNSTNGGGSRRSADRGRDSSRRRGGRRTSSNTQS